MPWYTAHVILYTKFLDGIQDTYPVWENIVMIQAATPADAFAIAERKGRFEGDEQDSAGYTYDGRPAVWAYAGIRKLNEVLEGFDSELPEEQGTEVTYSSFILDSEEALHKLVENQDVSLLYEGEDSDE